MRDSEWVSDWVGGSTGVFVFVRRCFTLVRCVCYCVCVCAGEMFVKPED